MTDRAAASPGRFGQLTYSSFDAGTGNAGWQVKEATGDVTPRERDLITARIATRLDVGPMATFPTPEEIERLPRRLVYGSLPDGSAAYWHTAVAGMDASGRPGNVFVHVLLDRHPGSADDLRPIDLWRSPDWLTPFNPEQVVVAAIPAGPRPRPGAATGSTQAVGFLLDPSRWRIGVLTGLLDAVAAAMDEGLPVVLGVADIKDAARWLAAVSHLMSPGTARRLFFSTHERADTVRAAADAGMHVVCVPREDLPALPRDLAAVVIDDVETIQMGTIDGEPHETEHGSRIEVTPWSGIVQVVAAERDPAIALLAEADAVASAVGDVDLSPPWPLAATALRHPDTLREAQNDAVRAVLTSSPPLDGHPDLNAAVVRGVRSVVGADARQAWVHLEHVGSGHWSAVAGIVLDVYVQRVLDDVGWLTQPGHVPVPDLTQTAPPHLDPATVLGRVAALSARGVVQGNVPSATLAVETIRLTDFLLRARVIDGLGRGPGVAVWGAIETELQRLVVPVCLDASAVGAFTAAAGIVDPAVVRVVQELLSLELASQVQRGTAPPLGERVPSATLRWLFNGPLVGIADEIETWSAADLVTAERPVQEFLAAPDSGSARASLVVVLEEFARQRLVSDRLDIVALVAAAGLDVDELAALVARYGILVPPAAFIPALKSEPDSAALMQMCLRVARVAWEEGFLWGHPAREPEVESLVRLRSTVRAMWWECMGNEVERTTRARYLLHHAMRAFVDVAPEVPLQPEVLAHAQAAWLYLMLTHEGLYGSERQGVLLSHVSSGAAALALARVTGAIFGPARALAYGALTAPHSPLSARGVSIAATALLRAEVDGRTEPVLDLVVRRYLARPDGDPAALLDAALAESSAWVPGEAERGLDSWRKYLEQRIKHLGGRSGVINATLGRFRRA